MPARGPGETFARLGYVSMATQFEGIMREQCQKEDDKVAIPARRPPSDVGTTDQYSALREIDRTLQAKLRR